MESFLNKEWKIYMETFGTCRCRLAARNWGAPSSGRRFHNFPFGLSSFTKPEVAYENDVGNSFDGTMADKWTLLLVTF